MLQTRNAKRPAQAAVRFAVDAVEEGLLERDEALATIDAAALDALLHPTFDPDAKFDVLARGRQRLARRGEGRDRVHGGRRRRGRGGGPRRRARPAVHRGRRRRGLLRGQGHPHERGRQGEPRGAGGARDGPARRVRGVGARDRPLRARGARERNRPRRRATGSRSTARPASSPPTTSRSSRREVDENFDRVLGWADEVRKLGVRTNADTPEDARKAREFGAEGIGLCRTEHMFMAPERQEKMRAMIMAEEEDERRAALDELLPLQQEDFEGLFEEMAGLPVTIRLLDPPLHEFLPHEAEVAQEVERARIEVQRRPRGAREDARDDPPPRRDEPDARHARMPAGDHPSGDLRDAGARDRAGRARRQGGDRRRAAARDHDPAGRLREGARDHARRSWSAWSRTRAGRTST